MPTSWQSRVHRTVVAAQLVAYLVALIADLAGTGGTGRSFAAVAVAGVYVVATLAIPERLYRGRLATEAITLAGALLIAVALTLTGGASSPYLLLSAGPAVLATLYGGFRGGLTTGLLAVALLGLVTVARLDPFLDATPAMALYLVFVLLVGVIRRLLEDIHSQAATLAAEKETATQRLQALEEIHRSLVRLSEDISAGRLNAVEVAAETLDTLLNRYPDASGKLSMEGEGGLVVLASRGVPVDGGHPFQIPLAAAGARVGTLDLVTRQPLGGVEVDELSDFLRPLGLAFANLQLLQDIAGSAVAEERLRLAREMHDDIGPSLASLGLSLDMAAMQQVDDPGLAADLRVLRSNVTKLVEDIRAKVADLRSTPGPTLTARINEASSRLDGEPSVVIDLDERRPPRPAIISDLTAIVTEALRNAHAHSGGARVLVTGQVHRDWGRCQVVDDGGGFDPEVEPDGHYGLVGMRERAARIGATVAFESMEGSGTTVTIEWGRR